MKVFKCEYCDKDFTNGRSKSSHIKWNHSKNSILYKEQNKVLIRLANIKKFGEKKNFVVKCVKCETEIIIIEFEKVFPSKEKYYCSRKCANSRNHSEKTKGAIRDSLLKNRESKGYKAFHNLNCRYCKCDFYSKNCNTQFCSNECYIKDKMKDSSIKRRYAVFAKFRFGIRNYYEKFDTEEFEKYGWYKPSNKGNNLDGVSRDHMFSVSEGFKLKVNPLLVAHPANCKLIRQSDNSKKYSKSSINLETLLELIKKWDLENGKYYEKELELYIDLSDL